MFHYAQQACLRMHGTTNFTVILCDPPWNNTGCKLGYITLKNKEWMSKLDFSLIQDNGYVFMWVSNLNYASAISFMKKQSYKMVENITWVKITKDGRELRAILGAGTKHCKEDCLVFRKVNKNSKVTSFANLYKARNVIHAAPTGTSRKPIQLYETIELMTK